VAPRHFCAYWNELGQKKGYQGDELWSAINLATEKREIIEPEGELVPWKKIIKLYYCKRLDSHMTIPGASLFRVAANSIKTWEKDYDKYIKEADDNRDFVESEIQKSATSVKPVDDVSNSPTPPEKKKPPRNRRLKSGAGEEGRTPDLMLGKHTL